MANERTYMIEWGPQGEPYKVHHFMAADIDEAQDYRMEFCRAHMIMDSDLYAMVYNNQLIYCTKRPPWMEQVYGV